jgi:hypothetical protein
MKRATRVKATARKRLSRKKRYEGTAAQREISRRLAGLRLKGITNADVGKAVGYSTGNMISMISTGSAALTPSRVPAMAKALKMKRALLADLCTKSYPSTRGR